jgi:hypothetical protein
MSWAVRAFFTAVQEGRTEEVRKLLADGADGADVAAKDGHDTTALHIASAQGHTALVAVLFDAGSCVAAKDYIGWQPLDHASGKGHLAVMALLLDRGADIMATEPKGYTALHFCASQGFDAACTMLIEWAPLELEVGRQVRIKGLVSRADLNGETGKVTCFDPSTSRFGVRLKSGQHLAVRETLANR